MCRSDPSGASFSEAETRRRKSPRARQLGVSDAEYAARLAAQGGGCAICGATPKTRRLHVDHDHIAADEED